jgi:hypothetical protein
VTISALRRQLQALGLQISEARWGLPYRLVGAPLEPADLIEQLRAWRQLPGAAE